MPKMDIHERSSMAMALLTGQKMYTPKIRQKSSLGELFPKTGYESHLKTALFLQSGAILNKVLMEHHSE